MTIVVLDNQTFLDISIQYTGNVINAFEIAKYNSLAIDQMLTPGQEIEIPEDLELNENIMDFYKRKGIIPGTALSSENINQINGFDGIGCWIIMQDFIVS